MQKNSYQGKFIVFEGIDGSGKSTQSQLLVEHLKKAGFKVAFIKFPQYNTKSGGLIEKYLAGEYGKVGPYPASVFYAVDRFDGGFKIREWLSKGYIVVADRYVGSNIGHQGGKIHTKKERERFFKWLYDLEYRIFQIPSPTVSFILRVPPKVAQLLRRKLASQEHRQLDIHERDLLHLKNAQHAYLHVLKVFPKDFTAIECVPKGILLAPEIIHEQIWQEVQKIL